MKHLFSVVTTVYNGEDFIGRAMESVARQTERDFEYIIVDNGSTDSSKQIIEDFIKFNNDLDIKLVHLESNTGISGGRNEGIRNATGEYVCFLDADDFWLEMKLESVKMAISQYQEIDVLCHWEIHKSSVCENVARYRDIDNDKPYIDLLFNGNCLSTSALTVRKTMLECIKGFSDRLVSGEEDFDCWLRLAKEGAKFYMLKEPLGVWAIRDDSISAKHIKHTEAIIAMLQPHYDYLYTIGLESGLIEKKRRRNIAMLLCSCARSMAKEGMYDESKFLYKKSIKNDYKYMKSYIGMILNILKK